MKLTRSTGIVFLGLALALTAQAQPKKKRLLCIGASEGFQHDSISHGMATLWKLGQDSGLWDTFIRTDTQLITKKKLGANAKNLDYFDAVFFYTTGELKMDDEQKAALISFVKDDGKGFIGGHSSADTFYKWPEYGDLVGAYFDGHPWHQRIRVNVEDRTFPATRHLPAKFEIMDEIYQFRNWSRDKCRVLLTVDTTSVDLNAKGVKRTDKDFALVWVKQYGKGRVFINALGHDNEAWDRPDMQKLWLEGIKWAMGMVEGDTTPLPKPAN
jgi:type 1 glutamine amidotransferase